MRNFHARWICLIPLLLPIQWLLIGCGTGGSGGTPGGTPSCQKIVNCSSGFMPMWDNDSSCKYCGRVPSGCGLALTGDWPNPGAQFSVDYKYNLKAMMSNAQKVLGPKARPIWRYDWRSTEHPYSGPWTYVASDWCSGTKGDRVGLGEHPAANGSSPGFIGWNEPNVPGQCEVSLDATNLDAIREYVALARDFKKHGKFVVTPAPGGGSQWLDTFLGNCEKLNFTEIDYMAYHNYVACDSGKIGHVPFTTPEMMYAELRRELTDHIDVMQKYNARNFSIKGIWLAETACAPDGGWGRSGTWRMDAPDILMTQLFKLIDAFPELTAWAWFPYRQFGMFWNDTTYEINDLGKRYFSHCPQERFGFEHGGAELIV